MHEKYKITSALLMIYLYRYEYRQVYYPTYYSIHDAQFENFSEMLIFTHWKMFSFTNTHTFFIESTKDEAKINTREIFYHKFLIFLGTIKLFREWQFIAFVYYLLLLYLLKLENLHFKFFSNVVDFYHVRKCFQQFSDAILSCFFRGFVLTCENLLSTHFTILI